MKIAFTGGGTGGHVYPLIAVAEKVNTEIERQKILGVELYFFSDKEYDKGALFENNMTFVPITAGKLRLYFSFQNIVDIIKTPFAILDAILKLYKVYPDVIFSKGGYVSFPVLVAARLLGIPVMIHESDTYPGRVNTWAGKFAARIGVSYNEASVFFPKEKIAWTGQPVRQEIMNPEKTGQYEFFKLDSRLPILLILGGSQGADKINTVLLDALPDLLAKYQVIHQVGTKLVDIYKEEVNVVLGSDNPYKDRYVPLGFLNAVTLKNAAGAASLIISRAGSSLFEIANWGVPSIIIPITTSNGDHQRKNAFAYARAGGCIVIEETNLTPHVLVSQVEDILNNSVIYEGLKTGAKTFSHPDAAEIIAKELLSIALSHEKPTRSSGETGAPKTQ